MSATVLSVEAAAAANIEIIQNRKYTQALHDSIVAARAARRSGSANTKTKAEVNLSGAKPWRQKGTGRARAGYKSSPVWVGGGVVFGPKPRDYSKKVNRKVSKLALRKAFSERVNAGDVLTISSFAVNEPKTKAFVALLKSITPEEKVLVVGTEFSDETLLAGRNVAPTYLATALEVNPEDLLRYRKIVITDEALPVLAKRMVI